MPKEYVITDATRRRCDELGGRREAIRIGWERGGWVQIASVLRAGTDGSPTEIKSEVDEGWFVDLDRQSLNRIIRVLRTARDQAYGRDE